MSLLACQIRPQRLICLAGFPVIARLHKQEQVFLTALLCAGGIGGCLLLAFAP